MQKGTRTTRCEHWKFARRDVWAHQQCFLRWNGNNRHGCPPLHGMATTVTAAHHFQRSLHIAEKKYTCTHMLKSVCAHPPSSPYALTCPHAPATASVVLSRTLEIDVGYAQAYMYSCRSAIHIVRTEQSMRGWIVCGSPGMLLCST